MRPRTSQLETLMVSSPGLLRVLPLSAATQRSFVLSSDSTMIFAFFNFTVQTLPSLIIPRSPEEDGVHPCIGREARDRLNEGAVLSVYDCQFRQSLRHRLREREKTFCLAGNPSSVERSKLLVPQWQQRRLSDSPAFSFREKHSSPSHLWLYHHRCEGDKSNRLSPYWG